MPKEVKAGENSDSSRPVSPEDLAKIKDLSAYIYSRYHLPLSEILRKTRENTLPLSIFIKKLSCLESIVRFLRQNRRLSNKEIASLLNRKQNTISTTYNNSLKKFPGKLEEESDYFIPLEKIRSRRLSVLESVCIHLKSEYNLSNSRIAALLNRDMKTIWTVINRAKKKLEHE
jgi:DNA-binding NarL/FixJ family response regulator